MRKSIQYTFFSLFLSAFLPFAAFSATFSVNSPEASNDGSCVHPYVNSAQDCTLSEAIQAANTNSAEDSVIFAIDSSFHSQSAYSDGDDQYTITLTSALANITSPTNIDASTQWDVDDNRPGIRLYSNKTTFHALTFATGSQGSSVSGLEIQGFNTAVNIQTDNLVVGTNCDGVRDARERNVLHSGVYGVYITSSNSVVAGNYIGLQEDGDTFAGELTGGVYISGANADNNTIGFREGTLSTCSAENQRNVIAGTTGSNSHLVYIFGTGNAVAGDTALGADHNRVAGNYIGTDKTGYKNLTGKLQNSSTSNTAVRLSHSATLNWIGTDGDGVDDEYERNSIIASGIGINTIAQTTNIAGTNRIAGNYIGVNPTGNAVVPGNSISVGAIIHGTGNIIGWCDSSDHPILCSDNGSTQDQRNVMGGATVDQIRFGVAATGSYIYGNYIGVGANGTSDISTVPGIFIHRASTNNVIGGSGNRSNTIQNNTIGIQFNGDFTGNRNNSASKNPILNTQAINNTISQNRIGVQFYWTENFHTTPEPNITLTKNTIEQNETIGVDVWGSSPLIQGNAIRNNGTVGISVHPAFVMRDSRNEPVESFDPAYATDNLISSPEIVLNTIQGNTDGGVYQLDSRAKNFPTLYNDNAFGDNGGQPAVHQEWYAAVEVLDKNGDPIPSSAWSAVHPVLVPTGQKTAPTTATDFYDDVNGQDMVYGESAIEYTDIRTWTRVAEYDVSRIGDLQAYGPYRMVVDGSSIYRSNKKSAVYSFDGNDNDPDIGGLPNGIETDGLFRFQIAHVRTATVPDRPTPQGETIVQEKVSLTPVLEGSTFVDGGDSHFSTTWNVYASEQACLLENETNVLRHTSSTELTRFQVPENLLVGDTTYFWTVEYVNSFGNLSTPSRCAKMRTLRTQPTLVDFFPALEWEEDTQPEEIVDLAAYFSDEEGEALRYIIEPQDDAVQATFAEGTRLSWSSAAHWYGTTTVTVTACDTDDECVSGDVNVRVLSVNDAPTSPLNGFSPANSVFLATATPTFLWNPGTDVEDEAAQLFYEVVLSTVAIPIELPLFQLTSEPGSTIATLSSALQENTAYFWVVRTVDSQGAVSAWSSVQSFVVDEEHAPVMSIRKSVEVVESSSTESRFIGVGALAQTDTVVTPGDRLRYSVVMENSGDGDAHNAVLYDAIPKGTTFVPESMEVFIDDQAQPAEGSYSISSDGAIYMNLGTVTIGSSWRVAYDVVLDNPYAGETVDALAATFESDEYAGEGRISSQSVSLVLQIASLEIIVKTENGARKSGVEIFLYEEDGETLVWKGKTTQNGTVVVEGLRSGAYVVKADAGEKYTKAKKEVDVVYTQENTVTLTVQAIEEKEEEEDRGQESNHEDEEEQNEEDDQDAEAEAEEGDTDDVTDDTDEATAAAAAAAEQAAQQQAQSSASQNNGTLAATGASSMEKTSAVALLLLGFAALIFSRRYRMQ